MALPDPFQRTPDGRSAERARQSWLERRRDKIAEEIARNRRGEYIVPTWVLTVLLLLIVGTWGTLIVLS